MARNSCVKVASSMLGYPLQTLSCKYKKVENTFKNKKALGLNTKGFF
jgi:hypothetical protein